MSISRPPCPPTQVFTIRPAFAVLSLTVYLLLQYPLLLPHRVNRSVTLYSNRLLCLTSSDSIAWAKDEPPSPKDQHSITHRDTTEFRPSDVPSYNPSISDLSPNSRWWAFTLPRPTRQSPIPESHSATTAKPERRRISWLHTSSSMREGASFIRREKDPETSQAINGTNRFRGLSITLPTSPATPYTLSHNVTPGWDTPWSPRAAVRGTERLPVDDDLGETPTYPYESQQNADVQRAQKNRFRTFILTNTYVPLVSSRTLSSLF